MREIQVTDCDGIVTKQQIMSINELPIVEVIKNSTVSNGKRGAYYNVPVSFDIETTSYWNPDIDQPECWMYHWQFCMDTYVVFGRTWEEFQQLIEKLTEGYHGIRWLIWVHNLSFEFAFMIRFLTLEDMFCRDSHSPIYVRTPGIEWRCSYYLSNMSLDKLCKTTKGVRFWKKDSSLYDYSKMRTYNTPMLPYEEEYCFCDVYGLCEVIRSKMQDEPGGVGTFPYTSTGYIRRYFQQHCLPEMHDIVRDIRLYEETYTACKEAFRGGDTGGNVCYAGDILEDVQSWDLKSSYPGSLEIDKYPMSKFKRIYHPTERILKNWIAKGYAVLFRWSGRVKVKNLNIHPYIDKGHCRNLKNGRYDNGRVLSADYLERTDTDLDWKAIKSHYDLKNVEILDMWVAEYDYLPLCFREALLHLFEQKCELDILREIEDEHQEDNEFLYNKIKPMVNAAYGMMVTDPVHEEVICGKNKETGLYKWTTEKPAVKGALYRYYRNSRTFLTFQWGVWTTAHARYRLHKGKMAVGRDGIYEDTDSIKNINDHSETFELLNGEIKAQKEAVPDLNVWPVLQLPDGSGFKEFRLCCWEREKDYKRFIFLGAKKYAYEYADGSIHITVAGLHKKSGAEYLTKCGGLEAFQKEWKVPPEYSGRNTGYYIDAEIREITRNGDTFLTAGGVAMFPTTYKLGYTDEYEELIDKHNPEKGEKDFAIL